MGQTSVWDWLVIRVLLQIAGYTFKHVIKNTSDYLRGGGNMLWWVAGVSGVMGIIGSFVFTGGGEKMYKDGHKEGADYPGFGDERGCGPLCIEAWVVDLFD